MPNDAGMVVHVIIQAVVLIDALTWVGDKVDAKYDLGDDASNSKG